MKKRNNNAFTLMEILAASVILTVALAVIAASMSGSFSHFRSARTAQAAQRIAMEKLQLAASGAQTFPSNGSETEMSVNYNWQLRLITPSTSATGAVTKLACDVNWSFRNTPQTLTLERIIPPLANQQTQEGTQP